MVATDGQMAQMATDESNGESAKNSSFFICEICGK